ncbi:type II secretion system GspH family protein [Patescibacteria group bacterium]|nr:type II secretion system GspH family protein [Patescibacteria group bacterium]
MELLIVLGIMSVLAMIVISAINPLKQLEAARDASRISAIHQIESAIMQYINDGYSFSDIPIGKENAKNICRSASVPDCYNLTFLAPVYLVQIPIDDKETDVNFSGYRIYMLGSFLKVCSPRVDEDCGA